MMSSRRPLVIISSVGAGVLIGGGVLYLIWGRRLRSDISKLRQQIDVLRRDLERLQEVLIQNTNATGSVVAVSSVRALPNSKSSAHSRTFAAGPVVVDASSDPTSSTEDDDVYEEAYDGDNDIYMSKLTQAESGVDEFYTHIDKLFEGSDTDKREAFRALTERMDEFAEDVNYQWRMAKSTFFLSQLEAASNKELQKELSYKAKEYADKALALDKNCANAHKWYAITLGNIGDYEPIKNKIANGYSFKKYIETAIQLNPTDPTSHHLLGRWSFSVAILSWMERKMAATLFAEPPSATIDEALAHFLEADRLNPGKWKENSLYVAKCYMQMKDYKNTIKWADIANDVPCKGQDDQKVQVEVEAVLKQYSSYRS